MSCSDMYVASVNVIDIVQSEYSLYGHNNVQEMRRTMFANLTDQTRPRLFLQTTGNRSTMST
jgi:hypothetical protein